MLWSSLTFGSRRVLLPHGPRAGVGHRTVPVVDETAFGGAARLEDAVLPRARVLVAENLVLRLIIADGLAGIRQTPVGWTLWPRPTTEQPATRTQSGRLTRRRTPRFDTPRVVECVLSARFPRTLWWEVIWCDRDEHVGR